MSLFAFCPKTRLSAARRMSFAGVVSVLCVLSLAVCYRIVSSAAAGEPAKIAAANNTSGHFDEFDDEPAPPASASSTFSGVIVGSPFAPQGGANELTTEPENPEEYEAVVAKSLYPRTDPPHKLSLQQLEAIAKLAPKVNSEGFRVHPAMLPLFRSMVLHYTGGTYNNSPIRFRLHLPEPFQEGKKYPLVVWLHGAGECGSDNINQLSHLHHIIPYLVGPKKRDFFLLCPQCPHTHSDWEAPEVCSTTIRPDGTVECHLVDDPVALADAPVAFTLAMVDAVKRQFPVDPDQITVAGLSTGGDGTWQIVERRPGLFAAAAPIVSWRSFPEKALREHPQLKKIPIWAIYSSDDNGIGEARKEFERVREDGCNVHKTEFGVCGHRAWTPAMLQGDVFGWLITRAKEGERYFAALDSATSPEKIGIFADVTEGDLAKRTPTKVPVKTRLANEAVPGDADVFDDTDVKPLLAKKPAVAAPAPTDITPSAAIPPYGYAPYAVAPYVPGDASTPRVTDLDQDRMLLATRYLQSGQVQKAIEVANKVKNRQALVRSLLKNANPPQEILDYVDRELDRMEQRGEAQGAVSPGPGGPIAAPPAYLVPTPPIPPHSAYQPVRPATPLQPIPEGEKLPKDDCGKEWEMDTENLYGLFPNGWDKESSYVPDYVINETGKQLRDRLFKAFAENDLAAMKEFCQSFIRLDDIPLSSPWFDTSGGRLRGRIKYSLNEKSKPVVEFLREIAAVRADSKKEFVELARKSLERVDAITHPKSEK